MVFLLLWWVPFSLLNCLFHIPLCTPQVVVLLKFYPWAADPLSIHISKRKTYPLWRFLLPHICWYLPKYIVTLDFFLELQNLGPNCLLNIIIKMSPGISNLTGPKLFHYSSRYLVCQGHYPYSDQTKNQGAFSLSLYHSFFHQPLNKSYLILPNISCILPLLSILPSFLTHFSTLDYENLSISLPAKSLPTMLPNWLFHQQPPDHFTLPFKFLQRPPHRTQGTIKTLWDVLDFPKFDSFLSVSLISWLAVLLLCTYPVLFCFGTSLKES